MNDKRHRIRNQILPFCSYETLNKSLNFFLALLPLTCHTHFQHLPVTALWLTLWSDICSGGLLRRFLQMFTFITKYEVLHFFRKTSMTHRSTIFISRMIFSNLFHLDIHFLPTLTSFHTSYLIIIIIILRRAGNCSHLQLSKFSFFFHLEVGNNKHYIAKSTNFAYSFFWKMFGLFSICSSNVSVMPYYMFFF